MTLREDIARGCLETGESIEALWGAGWWSEDQRQATYPPVVQCFKCDGNAYDLGNAIDCENCGEIPVPAGRI